MIQFDYYFSNGLKPPTRFAIEAASQIDAGGGQGGRPDDADDAMGDDWNWNDEAQPSSPSLAIAAVRSVSQNDMFQDCWEMLPLSLPVDLYSSSQYFWPA